MTQDISKLTEAQIKEALEEIQDVNLDSQESLDSLTNCELNLRNVELEEEELEAAKKNKKSVVQYFSASDEKSKKVPAQTVIRQRKSSIKRALTLTNNADILITLLPVGAKKEVLDYMIAPYRCAVARCKASIDETIMRLLNALIPKALRAARANFGNLPFKEHPGFFWKCGPAYGSLEIWVKPDILYYFEQFREMDYLRRAYPPEKLNKVDYLIDRYLQAENRLSKRTTLLRSKLSRVDTYGDLINFNVDAAEAALEKELAKKNIQFASLLKDARAEDYKA